MDLCEREKGEVHSVYMHINKNVFVHMYIYTDMYKYTHIM